MKMKRIVNYVMCVCVMLVAMTACSGKGDNGLIGKWEQTVDANGVKTVVTYDFQNSGKLRQTMVMKNDALHIFIDAEGVYEYSYYEADKTINFKFSGSDFNFKAFEIEGVSDDQVELAMENMKSDKVDIEQEFTDVNIEGDRMTAKFNGIKLTLKRI